MDKRAVQKLVEKAKKQNFKKCIKFINKTIKSSVKDGKSSATFTIGGNLLLKLCEYYKNKDFTTITTDSNNLRISWE